MSAAVSFAATGKLPVRSGRNGARSLVPLNRVYTVLTQASTGPPRRGESNEMEHIVASGACLIIVSPQAWQARAHDFPFPSSALSPCCRPSPAGADFLIHNHVGKCFGMITRISSRLGLETCCTNSLWSGAVHKLKISPNHISSGY
jgi:hypothetical protein